jgi:phenylalanyl-tRNA synthetase alpha chain
MLDYIKKIEQEALSELGNIKNFPEAETFRLKYLSRNGLMAKILDQMKTLPQAERPPVGKVANELKTKLTLQINSCLEKLKINSFSPEKIDLTLPGLTYPLGHFHPITKTIEEINQIFISLGFSIVEGPEIESQHNNFEALNIPLDHPSCDAFDTFYLNAQISTDERNRLAQIKSSEKLLLRSHTSPVQVRFMEKNKPPFSIIVPGKVYRPDATDASHSFMFHQIEGLAVGEDIRFSDLKGVLTVFAQRFFGKDTKMRFRPHFFPFTEPSAEVDISCIICSKESNKDFHCSVCGGKKWLEILGAGMVHPNVLKAVKIDSQKCTGFAFGMGVERIAMLKYGINDIRLFFENDLRFLRQF